MRQPGRIHYALASDCPRVRRRFFLPAAPVSLRAQALRTVLPPPHVVEQAWVWQFEHGSLSAESLCARGAAWELVAGSVLVRAGDLECGSVSLVRDGMHASDETRRSPSAEYRERHGTAGSRGDVAPLPVGAAVPLQQRLAIVLAPSLASCLSTEGPLEWPGELLEFQKAGIAALVERRQMLLADDMGLGKTIQAVAAMRVLVRRGLVERVLVVAPAGVLRNWRIEIGKWAPELRVVEISGPQSQRAWKWRAQVHVKIVSYETLRSDAQMVTSAVSEDDGWDLICLDEAQRIKNPDSSVSITARRISAGRRWALTGTPLENSLEDVRTILSFLRPTDAHGQPIRLAGDHAVRSVLAQVQLRRKKTDVLPQLPSKTVTERYVQLTKPQRDEYERLLNGGVVELRDKGESVSVADVLALIMRLKQVCNFSLETGRSSKMDDVANRLRALRPEGHKALVFSQFTSEDYGVRRLAQGLAEFDPLIYTGDMSLAQRQDAIDLFARSPGHGVLILSLKAGGVGLNLQRASYVFHFDRWWNPATETQAEDRSHRIGQTRGVNVYKYVCEGTIEERIQEILVAKRVLFSEYVDDVCLDLRQLLTEEELFGLFGLPPPAKKRSGAETVDFREMTGEQFEDFVRQRLEEFGYRVETTPVTRDGGIDLVATTSDALGLATTLLVQCKNWSSPAGVDVVRELNGVLPRDGRPVQGMIAYPAGLTADATAFAEKHHILLWADTDLQRRPRTGAD